MSNAVPIPMGAIIVVVLTPALIMVSCSKPADAPILKPNEKLEEDSVVKVEDEPSPGG